MVVNSGENDGPDFVKEGYVVLKGGEGGSMYYR